MSKLFEDAIAEAKQLRDLAEQNAKNAIVEAVTPRIREFIEEQLLADENISENVDQDESVDNDVLEDVVNEIMSEMGDSDDLDDVDEESEEEKEVLVDSDQENLYELDEDALHLLSKMLNERTDLTPAEQKLKGIVLTVHKLKTELPNMSEQQKLHTQQIISQVKNHLLTNEGKMLENDMVNVDLNEEEVVEETEEVTEELNETFTSKKDQLLFEKLTKIWTK